MKTGCSWTRRGRIWMGLLLVVLLPVTAPGQWTMAGTATVEDMLGVGIQNPSRGIHLAGPNAVFRMDRDRYSSAFMLVRTATGDFDTIWKSFSIGVSASGVNDGVFTISDKDTTAGGTGPARFTIDNVGQVEIGSESEPQAGLHVRNPTTGHLLRLDSSSGEQVVTIQDDGDIYARGEDLELRLSNTSPNGYNLFSQSTLLANTCFGTGYESFFSMCERGAIVCTPGDWGLLQIIDQDNYVTNYLFADTLIEMREPNDIQILASRQHTGHDLYLITTGEQIKFVADSDNDTVNPVVFTWYNNGHTDSDRVMELTSVGDLSIDGSLNENHAFDLAEAYWKSEDDIGAGDVVRIDPDRPDAVVLAWKAEDRAVIGVVSTEPGITMGAGAFSAEKLADRWGKDAGRQFAKERDRFETELAATDPGIKARAAQVARKKSAAANRGRSVEENQAAEQLQREEQELAEALESAALEAYCRENLALVALAGRVPVKVDASYGAIEIGDALVASATPGHAMRSENPPVFNVIGKALEPYAAGRGTIMMMVLNR